MDTKLFRGTAKYYSKYRAGYPKEFFDYITQHFCLQKNGRLLDLACGTGQLTIPLARNFKEVIGLDQEQEMLDEAEIEAKKSATENVSWILSRAEDISFELGRFNLITIGTAFHWMERDNVLKKAYDLIEDKGVLLIVSNISDNPGSQGWTHEEDAWKEARKKIVRKYLGERRRAGNTLYAPSDRKFKDHLVQSQFGNCEEKVFTHTKTWNLEEVINHLYSTSYASKALLGDKITSFEADLKAELLKCEPAGIFVEHVKTQLLISIKK